MRLNPQQRRELEKVMESRQNYEEAFGQARRAVRDAVVAGLPRAAAAEGLGITRMTLHRWLGELKEPPVADAPSPSDTTQMEGPMIGTAENDPLDKQTRHTTAEAYLVVAHLNYRAGVTRHGPPTLSKIRDLYGDISPERAKFIQAQTDRRIEQAAKRLHTGAW